LKVIPAPAQWEIYLQVLSNMASILSAHSRESSTHLFRSLKFFVIASYLAV
jgi:hypothetical protein